MKGRWFSPAYFHKYHAGARVTAGILNQKWILTYHNSQSNKQTFTCATLIIVTYCDLFLSRLFLGSSKISNNSETCMDFQFLPSYLSNFCYKAFRVTILILYKLLTLEWPILCRVSSSDPTVKTLGLFFPYELVQYISHLSPRDQNPRDFLMMWV